MLGWLFYTVGIAWSIARTYARQTSVKLGCASLVLAGLVIVIIRYFVA